MYSLPIRDGDLTVDLEALYNLMVQAATVHNGGTFPAGANELWHGGVHIGPSAEGIPFHAPLPGTIVAARLGADNTELYGSPNFLLLRHQWPPFAEDGEGTPFYSLYMHLAPTNPGPLATDPEEASWLLSEDTLVVEAASLNVRDAPYGTDRGIDASAGDRFPILSDPDDPTMEGGYDWHRVDHPDVDGEAWLAADNGTYATALSASITGETLTNLKAGEVVSLDVDVAAGTALWWTGTFGFPDAEVVDDFPLGELFRRSPTLHWEVFAGEPVLGHEEGAGDGTEVGAWNAVEDDNDDYVMDPGEVGMLYDRMEQLWSESDATEVIDASDFTSATPEERLPFYIETPPLRRTAAKFRSEWDIQDEEIAMEGLQWWGEAAGAGVDLPSDSKTWHYHPVGALEAIRPRFTVERNGTPLDGPVETVYDIAEKVIADLDNVSGDLSSLSGNQLSRVRAEMDNNIQINAAAPATEAPEDFANFNFNQSSSGYLTLNGSDYFFGIYVTDSGENDPGLYEMLEGDEQGQGGGPMQGVPGRTPPNPNDGGPEDENAWTNGNGWFGEFEQEIWASITESEGTVQAINNYDGAVLSVGPVQQTIGPINYRGELPGALHTLKQHAPETYWHHFGRFGLEVADAQIVSGAKKAYFQLRGEVLDDAEKKEPLRALKWAHRFQQSMQDPAVRYWIMREGFERLRRIRDQTLLLTVDPPSREGSISFHARIGDLFRRDLMQALLLDWHVNYPAEVWMQELGEYYINADGERAYDPGNQWRDHLQDHLETWAGQWSQTLTEALPFAEDNRGNLNRDDNGHLTLDGPLDLSDTEAYQLTASLLAARLEGAMTDPEGRAIGILKHTEENDIQSLATTTQPPQDPQTVPAFLTRVLNLENSRDHTGEGAWEDIQNHGAAPLSFASA